MTRRIGRLNAIKVAAIKTKGLHPDGDGLYLQVGPGGSKSWIFRFKLNGRARDMGLGSFKDISLAEARELAAEARRLHAKGKDPIEQRRNSLAEENLARARLATFRDCAEQLISSHEVSWRNAKHRQQWRNTLATYAYPILGAHPVADVDTGLVLRVLQQPVKGEHGKRTSLWNARTETASRLRGRIEAVLSWAKSHGLREGENPALWRGHLSNLLPRRSRIRRVRHHPALPYRRMPEFMAELRKREGVAPRALEFAILTAARTGEAVGARWAEIEADGVAWVIPPERMKSGREQRVPLSRRAVAIIEEMAASRLNDFVFPGMKHGRPLSDMSLLMLLRDMGCGDFTVHGFRSSFRDWAAETTNLPREVAEAALAHVVRDKVEAAYRRSDLFDKRRALMEAWARYLSRESLASPHEIACQLFRKKREGSRRQLC